MNKLLRVLIIEDNTDDVDLLLLELRRNGYQVNFERVDTATDLLTALTTSEWDVILSDYSMPGFSAPDALKIIQERNLDLPFIIVSGTVDEDTAVTAMKAGAHDFFAKGKLQRLIPAIERELRETQERRLRREAEEQLRQSEKRFATAFQSSPVGISIISASGHLIDANNYFLTLFGYQRHEVIGRTTLELDLWQSTDKQEQIVELMSSQSGSIRNYEGQCRTRSGEVRDVLASFERIELGGEICILSLLHDVTERKQAQDELRALYNAISYLFQADSVLSLGQQIVQAVIHEFGQMDCGLLLVDHERNQMTRLARAGISQVRTEAPLYLNGKGLVPEAVNHEVVIYVPDVAHDSRYIANNPQTQSELVIPLRTRKGVVGVLDFQSTEIDAFSERDRRIVIAFAERAAAAIEAMQLHEAVNKYAAELEWRVMQRTAELQQTKERVEVILNNSSDAILLVYPDGLIQQVNSAFTDLFGIEQDAAYNQSLMTLFEPQQITSIHKALLSVAQTKQIAHIDLMARRHDGTYFDVELAIAPAVEKDGRQISLICNIRDVTQRKQVEYKLRNALEKEKELNELKSRFVSMVSHEFRTPLATILASSDILKLYADRMNNDKRLQHLDRIHNQIKRMTQLLDDVLTLSKSEAVGIVMTPSWTNLQSYCQDIVDAMRLIAPTHPITFTYLGDSQPVHIDQELLYQVFTNLLSNAIKYSPSGNPIVFDVQCESDQVSFYVRDQGIGIPKEDQVHLFEAFHRAGNVNTIQGTGLGLVIVKRAVEAHMGTIHFESAVGVGTTFSIHIPLQI